MRILVLLSIILSTARKISCAQQNHSLGVNIEINKSYDYIVVGAGVTGIVVADRLSEAGKKVLLIERGGPSTAETGGNDVLPWANATQFTRFDIPGAARSMIPWKGQYWWCDDVDTPAGCLVGGGAAISGILYWYPTDLEYSKYNGWPDGWQSILPYLFKVKARMPSTDDPSRDGKYYLNQPYEVLSSMLNKQGYTRINANADRNRKDRVYAHSDYFIQDGKRNGPMNTYLKTARARPNFTILTHTKVISVLRDGGHITGVQTNNSALGSNGAIQLAKNGRVILAAGVFGTSKILFQSGIGPNDMLSIAATNPSVSRYMPPSTQYINLPVGMNTTDNPTVSVTFTHPSIDGYNWTAVATNPRPADAEQYLYDRSGILTAPTSRVNFWRAYNGSDGRTRYSQGGCGSGGSVPPGSSYNASAVFSCVVALYNGLTSAGRIGIDSSFRSKILKTPWLNTSEDKTALTSALTDFISTYQQVPELQLISPNISVTLEAYVTNSVGGSNHWVGSTKIGTSASDSVVDPDTKVWHTDNLFIVDAGVYPGVTTGNPTGSLLVMSEMAADKISALTGGP
ncbi:GMC oxidoreductase [Ceratobasidium sp. AG-Ba]|nr:GMC oxidoreductase [Ceratobasidium sp. AG-Ba]